MLTHKKACDFVKFLAIRSVQIAQSGHPGAPLGCADVMTILWRNWLSVCPKNPTWVNRDRFVLSNGHASALLYSLLYLRGFPISWDDLGKFRTLHSLTPGHPERDVEHGIEATTGPLGQGLGCAVGMALAEAIQSKQWREKGAPELMEHYTYALVGDGCLMEGVSHEVANLASVWSLDKLIVMWDDNQITIDGPVSKVSKEDTLARFRSYGWDVLADVDGHDPLAIDEAFRWTRNRNGKPKFIDFKTVIGCGVQDAQGSASMHGSPLKSAQWSQLLQDLDVDEAMLQNADQLKAWQEPCLAHYEDWLKKVYLLDDSRMIKTLLDISEDELRIPELGLVQRAMSTREASHVWIQAACAINERLVGGSADLDASVLTHPGEKSIAPYVHYGVREFGMCVVANGLALSGYRPFVGTFLVFSDYAKNAIRMAAMMKLCVIYVFTHDSIALGEDGPTHQPVEQLLSLRAIPNLETWRPADARETYAVWEEAMMRQSGPSALILSRQSLPVVAPENVDVSQGAYYIVACDHPVLILLASGSEVALAVEVREQLAHLAIAVVSCPNLNRLRHSPMHKTLQNKAPIFVIEAGSSWCWGDIQPDPDYRVTMDSFGVSAPGKIAQSEFGFSTEAVITKLQKIGYV